jgi:hypothetical protein
MSKLKQLQEPHKPLHFPRIGTTAGLSQSTAEMFHRTLLERMAFDMLAACPPAHWHQAEAQSTSLYFRLAHGLP